jgi:hypothetical protein
LGWGRGLGSDGRGEAGGLPCRGTGGDEDEEKKEEEEEDRKIAGWGWGSVVA